MAKKKLTIERVREFAKEHEKNGGNIVLEYWDDLRIKQYIDAGGTLKGLKELFDAWSQED